VILFFFFFFDSSTTIRMAKKENPELEFHKALNSNREELARAILLSHPGLDINKHGTIHWATLFKRDHAVNYLLSLGCKLDTFMLHNSTPFLLGLQNYSTVDDKISIASRFLKAGASVNLGKKDGESPLVSVYNEKVGKFLLHHGADVNVIEKTSEWSVLMKYCDSNRKSMIELILKEGYCHNINHIGQYGYTALLIAVEKGYADIVELLLKYGADPTITTPSGRSLLDITKDARIRKILSVAIANAKCGSTIKEMQKESAAVSGKVLQPYEEFLPTKEKGKETIAIIAPAKVFHESSTVSRPSPEDVVSFFPSSKFEEMKPGYHFRNGQKGIGYYLNSRVEQEEGPSKITKKKGKSNSISSFFFGSKSSDKKADGSYKEPNELERTVFEETSNRRIIENQNIRNENSTPRTENYPNLKLNQQQQLKTDTVASPPITNPPFSSPTVSPPVTSSSFNSAANTRLTSIPPYAVMSNSSEIPTANAILMVDEQQTTLYNENNIHPLSSSSSISPDWNFILNKINSLEKKLEQCEQTITAQQKEITFLKSKIT
jgi:ankyrin repeat protein